MTLILTMTTLGEVIHVSDRRVSLIRPGHEPRVHSPVENKTIIFLLRDAVGVMGYTGAAYVGTMPTDQWLAGQIAGRPVLERFAFSSGRFPVGTLNQTLWRIRTSLGTGALSTKEGVTINLGGYRRRSRYTYPFFAEISWPPGFGPNEIRMRLPRSTDEFTMVSAIGDPPPNDDLRRLFNEGAATANATGQNPRIGGLAHIIRSRAMESALVGPDLMAVRIPFPSHRLVEWTFMPVTPHTALLRGHTIPLAEARYSPWIITPGVMQAPSLGTGHFTLQAGEWKIQPVESEVAGEGPVLFGVSSQDRKPRPR